MEHKNMYSVIDQEQSMQSQAIYTHTVPVRSLDTNSFQGFFFLLLTIFYIVDFYREDIKTMK